MTERWQQYFDQQGALGSQWLRAAVSHWGFNGILYAMIQRYFTPPAKILDVGCGPGWSDMLLNSMGYDVTGIDNDEVLIASAQSLCERLGGDRSTLRFARGDAFNLEPWYGAFDLAYSCGVLEHFDRETTVQLLREQAKCAKCVLIQIPTKYTARYIGITDERIYSVKELENIVRDAGLRVEIAFGYGDITATQGHIWLRRLLPRGILRWLQNRGYCFSIAVLGVCEQ